MADVPYEQTIVYSFDSEADFNRAKAYLDLELVPGWLRTDDQPTITITLQTTGISSIE